MVWGVGGRDGTTQGARDRGASKQREGRKREWLGDRRASREGAERWQFCKAHNGRGQSRSKWEGTHTCTSGHTCCRQGTRKNMLFYTNYSLCVPQDAASNICMPFVFTCDWQAQEANCCQQPDRPGRGELLMVILATRTKADVQ